MAGRKNTDPGGGPGQDEGIDAGLTAPTNRPAAGPVQDLALVRARPDPIAQQAERTRAYFELLARVAKRKRHCDEQCPKRRVLAALRWRLQRRSP